jgi:hypothetical protein
MNHVRDYNKLQGVSHFSDLYGLGRRDINHRRVTIENDGGHPVGVGITIYPYGETPQPNFILQPKESKDVAINSYNSTPQYLWILNLETKESLGQHDIIGSNTSHIVLKQGLNKWMILYFKQAKRF